MVENSPPDHPLRAATGSWSLIFSFQKQWAISGAEVRLCRDGRLLRGAERGAAGAGDRAGRGDQIQRPDPAAGVVAGDSEQPAGQEAAAQRAGQVQGKFGVGFWVLWTFISSWVVSRDG